MTLLNKDCVKVKNLLGLHIKSNTYETHNDAIYDIICYMEERGTKSITSSNIHYALKIKVGSNYIDALMKWAVENSYFDASETSKKKTYTLVLSPFK